jgi:hypothetical protein
MSIILMNQTQNQRSPSRKSRQSALVTPGPQRRTRKKPKSRPPRFAEAIAVAARYQHLVPRGRSILFFGTKNARTIIRDDRLRSFNPSGPLTISLTRSLHVAVHFAMLDRDNPEATGAILLLDRELLSTRYKLVPHHDPVISTLLGYDEPSTMEAEEMVEVDAIVDLKRYLLGVIWLQKDEEYFYPTRRRRRSLPRQLSRARVSLRNRHVQPNPMTIRLPNEL